MMLLTVALDVALRAASTCRSGVSTLATTFFFVLPVQVRGNCTHVASAHGRFLAMTARSLHCRDSVRLQCYFHRSDELASMPARDHFYRQ